MSDTYYLYEVEDGMLFHFRKCYVLPRGYVITRNYRPVICRSLVRLQTEIQCGGYDHINSQHIADILEDERETDRYSQTKAQLYSQVEIVE